MSFIFFFFFFNDPATTEIYTLSLHDALPIYAVLVEVAAGEREPGVAGDGGEGELMALLVAGAQHQPLPVGARSEEHTSELQSQSNLVCRLLLEKKKKRIH